MTLKPHELTAQLVTLKQTGQTREPYAPAYRARYADRLALYAAELRRLRNPDILARVLDTLTTEIAALRARQSIPADAPLRTHDTDTTQLPLGGDVEITTTRGQAPDVVITAVDRLAALLDGDWVLIVSGDQLHLTVRPAPTLGSPPRALRGVNVPGYGQSLQPAGERP